MTEATAAGWNLAGVTCVLADGSPASTVPVERGVGITLAAIDGVTCTFENTIQTPTAVTLGALKAAANRPALAWPWLLALGTTALGTAWVVWRRRSTTA